MKKRNSEPQEVMKPQKITNKSSNILETIIKRISLDKNELLIKSAEELIAVGKIVSSNK